MYLLYKTPFSQSEYYKTVWSLLYFRAHKLIQNTQCVLQKLIQICFSNAVCYLHSTLKHALSSSICNRSQLCLIMIQHIKSQNCAKIIDLSPLLHSLSKITYSTPHIIILQAYIIFLLTADCVQDILQQFNKQEVNRLTFLFQKQYYQF